MDGKEDFPAFPAFDGVQLYNGAVGEVFSEGEEILIGTPNPAGTIHFKGIMSGSSGFITDLAWQVDVPGRKDARMNIVVDGLF